MIAIGKLGPLVEKAIYLFCLLFSIIRLPNSRENCYRVNVQLCCSVYTSHQLPSPLDILYRFLSNFIIALVKTVNTSLNC